MDLNSVQILLLLVVAFAALLYKCPSVADNIKHNLLAFMEGLQGDADLYEDIERKLAESKQRRAEESKA